MDRRYCGLHHVFTGLDQFSSISFGKSPLQDLPRRLSKFIKYKNRRGQQQKEDQVRKRKCFRLEDLLKERKVNHEQLAHYRASDGIEKHSIAQKTNLK